MKIGIVSQWRNQGQATLSRHLRDALDALGHETFVLARPTRDQHLLPGVVSHDDVWDQPRVTTASNYQIPSDEYRAWVDANGIEALFLNQNYQFEALKKLRARGVRTFGFFVWESFRADHVAPARAAYDIVYSLNACTRDRYAQLGLDSPLLRWGIHPELLAVGSEARDESTVRLFFPGGVLGGRKPIASVLAAFRAVADPRLRIVFKAQVEQGRGETLDLGADPRIETVLADLPCAEYFRLMASCHALIAVSRWEGMGLHFLEAPAFGMPSIANDYPPMNEMVKDDWNGVLVKSHVGGATKSGIPSIEPDIADLTRAFERIADDATRARLAREALEQRAQLDWKDTIEDFRRLLAGEAQSSPRANSAMRAARAE